MRLIDADALLEQVDKIGAKVMLWSYIRGLITNAPTVQQSEPFGYFKAEPFGWTDCAETDEGAIALYEAPTVQREGWVSVDTIALDVARKIMLEINTMTIPVDVRRMPQLQAKIQLVIAESISAAPKE